MELLKRTHFETVAAFVRKQKWQVPLLGRHIKEEQSLSAMSIMRQWLDAGYSVSDLEPYVMMANMSQVVLNPLSANQQARWTNGQYYSTPGQQRSALAQTLNVETAIPLWVPPVAPGGTAHQILRIGAEVTTPGAATSVVRLAARKDNGSGVPSTLVGGLDAGTIDGTLAAAQEITPATPISLPFEPLVWLTAATQVVSCTSRVFATNGFMLPVSAASLVSATGSSVASGYQQGSVTGAFPNSWAGATSIASPLLVVVKVS